MPCFHLYSGCSDSDEVNFKSQAAMKWPTDLRSSLKGSESVVVTAWRFQVPLLLCRILGLANVNLELVFYMPLWSYHDNLPGMQLS